MVGMGCKCSVGLGEVQVGLCGSQNYGSLANALAIWRAEKAGLLLFRIFHLQPYSHGTHDPLGVRT